MLSRKQRAHGFQLEFHTTIAIVSVLSTFVFFYTAFPAYAKVATPLAGGLGSIMLALYVYLPRVISGIRARFHAIKNKNRLKVSRGRHSVSRSNRYANGAFMAFGIAIGYASTFVPEQTLWVLAVGLAACAIAYLVIALRSHDRNIWWVYGMQTLILVIAAISPLTTKPLNALWVLVFVILGCVGVALDIKMKR